MKAMSQFFQGPIALDYSELLESDVLIHAAAKKKPAKKKPSRKKADTTNGPGCTSPNVCTVSGCQNKKPYKAMADVAAWSTPPAPPQLSA